MLSKDTGCARFGFGFSRGLLVGLLLEKGIGAGCDAMRCDATRKAKGTEEKRIVVVVVVVSGQGFSAAAAAAAPLERRHPMLRLDAYSVVG